MSLRSRLPTNPNGATTVYARLARSAYPQRVEIAASVARQQTPPDKGAQDALAQGGLHLEHGIPINATGRVEDDTRRCGLDIGILCHFLKHPIDHANVEMRMLVQAGAEPMNEGDCADVARTTFRLTQQ